MRLDTDHAAVRSVTVQKFRAGRACVHARLASIYAPVQDLLKKIEAAAEARLSFSTNATPPEKLARYKGFLKVETHRLKLLHRAGADGLKICQARAAILDALKAISGPKRRAAAVRQ